MKTTKTETNAAAEVKNDQVITTNKGENMTDKLTTKCVAAINKQAKMEKGAWIEQGRLVMEYVEAFKGTDDAALKKLADHPECIHGFQQLRNYWKAFEVYESVKAITGISNLPMTHYAAVQSKGLTSDVRENLLKAAVQNGWSVADLKAAIPSKKSSDKKTSSSKVVSQLKRIYSEMLKINSDEQEEVLDDETHDELVGTLNRLFALANSKGWLDPKPSEETDDTDDLFEDAA